MVTYCARMKKNKSFRSENPMCVPNKCLEQIKYQTLLLTYAAISKLPSNISTIQLSLNQCISIMFNPNSIGLK